LDRSLISEYAHLHATSSYGATGGWVVPYLLPHLVALGPHSLIDYGCGQSDLALRLCRKGGIPDIARYDPAIPELAAVPRRKFDVLINVDVLEHVPESEIDNVVTEMASMATHAAIIIDTKPAKTLLRDGRNAHVSQHDGVWWQERLSGILPGIRPFAVGRPSRIAFKTWDAELPALRTFWLTTRERLGRGGGRLLLKLGRRA
jgi:hypothetical protein